MVNLLPGPLRAPGAGIHELTMRQWYSDGMHDVIRDWFYFWRYIDPLPSELQAFVLHDDLGTLVTTEFGKAPIFDPRDLQALSNLTFPEIPVKQLGEIVSKARARIDTEIRMFEEKQPSTGKRLLDHSPSLQFREYEIQGSHFGEVGADFLYKRARQRFFFLLNANEILHALTTTDPQSHLDNLLYEDECSFNGYLFVENGKVHLAPPAVFSILLGSEVSRIRRCQICENYFWAGRKDKLVCTLQCGATKRKRLERKKYSEKKIAKTQRTKKKLPRRRRKS
jgi:hypothetical protein